jgi:hypothetical protein
VLRCAASETDFCLTDPQIASLRAIYHGPQIPDGTQIYFGFPPGGEAAPASPSWDLWIFGAAPGASIQMQVVGVPDRRMGEELCAWIRLAADETCREDEIRTFCQGRIAHHKVPRSIRFVHAFPMTATGKVQKFIIRERMIRELM